MEVAPKAEVRRLLGFAVGIDVSNVDQLDHPATALAVHRSRKRISSFRLHRPANGADANRLLADYPSARVVAGGIDVVNRLKCGETIEDVVSIGHLSSLRQINFAENEILHVGAVCTHHDLATSAVVRRAIPALASQWGRIANPRIRFRGTVGGNLMARHPDYEGRTFWRRPARHYRTRRRVREKSSPAPSICRSLRCQRLASGRRGGALRTGPPDRV